MGYPLDLDEQTIDKLKGELSRRNDLFNKGLCTYCERPHKIKPTCRFEERHKGFIK